LEELGAIFYLVLLIHFTIYAEDARWNMMLNSYVGSRESIANTRDAWRSRLLIDGQNFERGN